MRAWGTALMVVTLVLYVVMMAVSLLAIGAPAGQTAMPDIRVLGYTPDDMRAFLSGIGAEGRETFFGVLHWLDMMFPPLFGVTILLAFRRMVPRSKGRLIGFLTVPVVVYIAADLSENSFLYGMRNGVDFDNTVAVASMMTRAKFGALGVAVLGLAAGFFYSRRRL